MKETTLWKCDICGTEYRDKKQCQTCKSNRRFLFERVQQKFDEAGLGND